MNPFVSLSQDDFAAAMAKLLPPGSAVDGVSAFGLRALLQGLATQHMSLHARAVTLSEVESDPASTIELLGDWEAEYGLPDPCTPYNPSIEQRHIALLGKIASIGGQSDDYLIGVAAAMGFAISIAHLRTSRVGISVVGDPLNGPNADYTMVISTTSVRMIWSLAGQARIGDPLNFVDNTQLECRLRSIAPASDFLVFNYG